MAKFIVFRKVPNYSKYEYIAAPSGYQWEGGDVVRTEVKGGHELTFNKDRAFHFLEGDAMEIVSEGTGFRMERAEMNGEE